METIINKTMDRSDLFHQDAAPVVEALNRLIQMLYSRGLYMTSWGGTLPREEPASQPTLKRLAKKILGRQPPSLDRRNRGPDYQPYPGVADDARIPWYLYWEVYWVMKHGPHLEPAMRLLDAGGTSSLFSCYLASLGHEVHSVDTNPALAENGEKIARAMGWKMHSHVMPIERMAFSDAYFGHAYSICVFEHLQFAQKQAALAEIARCLQPGGTLSLTFDYRNPAPWIWTKGPDASGENQLAAEADLRRSFLSSGHFELLGNQSFHDNGQSYLVHPLADDAPYTFGALFLRRKGMTSGA